MSKVKVRKLTIGELKEMVLREKKRYLSEKALVEKPKEVDADEYADTLEKKVDYCKMLKLKEEKLRKELSDVQKARRVIASFDKKKE